MQCVKRRPRLASLAAALIWTATVCAAQPEPPQDAASAGPATIQSAATTPDGSITAPTSPSSTAPNGAASTDNASTGNAAMGAAQTGPAPNSDDGADCGRVSVRDLGATGDGQTDDTAALRRAADRGGEIRFPRGTYRITQPIVVDLDRVGWTSLVSDGTATLVMAGPGPALQVLGTHGGTADPKTVRDNVWQRQRTPLIDGLEIVGEHPEAIGLWLQGTMQPIVTRLTVRRALHGVYLTGRSRNVIVSQCHLYDNQGVGLLLDKLDLHQVNVTNCHISYNRSGGIVVRGSSVRNLQIGSCDIEANMAADGPPAANILLDCTEDRSSVREGAIVGCTLQHSSEPVDSANIRFLGHSAEVANKVGYFSIADNQISDTGINVHLVHAQGIAITGNTFFQGHQHNVLAEGCSQLVIGSNLFGRNRDYPPGSRDGVLLADCRDCTLNGLQIFNALAEPAALALRRCQRMNVTGCTILDCDTCGILLEDVHSVRVSGCLVRDDRTDDPRPIALRLTGGQGNMIVDNLLAGQTEIAPNTGVVRGNDDAAAP